ncbi:unnamed protein product [Thlaspi arvense]|uniref:Uncharacterized protein n=1 Tax=Thlaspi arvense TaxID=13288 RepID=A0AAU9R9P2_THLAR|nr:unnamed protein product [Thlaspi arvense]
MDLGAESRKLNGINEIEVITAKTSDKAHPPCDNDFDCLFRCPMSGICDLKLHTCICDSL